MGQFNLPKSNKMMPPKKVNAVLDMQSDAAVGMPLKVKVPGKKPPKGFVKDADKDMLLEKDLDKDAEEFGVFLRLRSWIADATAGVKVRADFHDDEDNKFRGRD
jgi:hypothetical protein